MGLPVTKTILTYLAILLNLNLNLELTNQKEHYNVGYKKGTTAILKGGERESPHITQSHRHGYAGHEKLQTIGPIGA